MYKHMIAYFLFYFSEWLLINAMWAIFQPYHGKNKLHFNEMMSARYQTIFIVLAHWNNSLQVNMLLHSDTLYWFRANQSLLLLLNTVCLAEK